MTNWVKFTNTSITYLRGTTLENILKRSKVKSLNLAHNNILRIPLILNQTIGKLDKLWLSGNPVKCDCDMLWLISWLNNTRVSGQRLVQDYQDIICTGGKLDGNPVYKVDKVKLGCYPEIVARWIIVVSSVTSGLILITVIVTIIIHRKWNAVRWILYKNFDKLLGDPDRNEILDNMQFDAFLSFW